MYLYQFPPLRLFDFVLGMCAAELAQCAADACTAARSFASRHPPPLRHHRADDWPLSFRP